jgi:hypothetical protein
VFRHGVFRRTEDRIIYDLVFYGGVTIYAIGIASNASDILK